MAIAGDQRSPLRAADRARRPRKRTSIPPLAPHELDQVGSVAPQVVEIDDNRHVGPNLAVISDRTAVESLAENARRRVGAPSSEARLVLFAAAVVFGHRGESFALERIDVPAQFGDAVHGELMFDSTFLREESKHQFGVVSKSSAARSLSVRGTRLRPA